MESLIDKSSGRKFFVKVGEKNKFKTEQHGLIEWCRQFLSKNTSFVDIDADDGHFSVVLSNGCKTVFSFEADQEKYERLSVTISCNNIWNIDTFDVLLSDKDLVVNQSGEHTTKDLPQTMVKTLDSYHLSDISFLKIYCNGRELEVIKGAVGTLKSNGYPPFIVKLDSKLEKSREVINYINSIGYRIYQVRGTDDVYLASDHPEKTKSRRELREEEAVSDKVVNNNSFDNFLDQLENETEEERLQSLAEHCLRKLKPDNALIFAREVIRRAQLYGRIVSDKVLEIISATAPKEDALEALEELIGRFTLSFDDRNKIIGRLSNYIKPLPYLLKVILPPGEENDLFHNSSPSVIRTESGYRCNIRMVNYDLNRGKYFIRSSDGKVRTNNIIVDLDENFFVSNRRRLTDDSGFKKYQSPITGMEDVRLFGEKYFFCTCLETNEKSTPQICWGEYDERNGSVVKFIPLSIGGEIICEKNWMPYINDDGEIIVIYSVHPLKRYRLDRENGSLYLIQSEKLSVKNISDYRGSAPPIRYKDGWLAIIHQVYHNEERIYYHRFLWWNSSFEKMMVSKPFIIDRPGIEFILSIAHHSKGFLISYSVSDSCSGLMVVEESAIQWSNAY